MNDNFNNKDFEHFVKQNADQYRMFPSEKVWKNIHHSLHTRRRWFGLGLIVLFLTAGTVTWVMLSNSHNENNSVSYQPAVVSKTDPAVQKNNNIPILIKAEKTANNKTPIITTTEDLRKNLFNPLPENNIYQNNETGINTFISELASTKEPEVLSTQAEGIEIPAKLVAVNNKKHTPVLTKTTSIFIQQKNRNPIIAQSKTTELPEQVKNTDVIIEEAKLLSFENADKVKKPNRFGKKLSWEVFITPTISYRKLSESKDFINSAQGNNYNYTTVAGINSLVTHKPDMGIRLGFNAGYPISKNFNIIAGLQFNVSKYDIKASFSTAEVATIALNTGGGTNSVSTFSNYRNVSDSRADWLRNFYFSASIPVGFELNLNSNKKTPIGISGTIQPTYILGNRAYLLSTDYKNYIEVPSLTNKWNMSTSFEMYAGYSTGNINWRIGPQVRYQLKSSYKATYPIKEHLFDYGVKVGIMLK